MSTDKQSIIEGKETKAKEYEELLKKQQEEQERREREAAILRQKYKNLYSQLNNIKLKLIDLNNYYQELSFDMKKNITVDNQTIEEDTLKTLKKDNDKVLQELTNIVIPRIRNNF